ncbi:conserved Plasmodium protein, unknown function [Plasmodium vivax]|uniref:BCNT-C domain-containing protein n=6 Tax=Plasmodium vivax TaxID=5855 RepID=A5KAY4_PLAVS|nr:hypothetical protein, conserved [Plasmodium vivax]KMZ79892.1 hypothetical protein PVIIG_04148 [Plasmodium vivax India VII]KMZ86407.1 hypothetical protein PVBG_01928 [Plasmodium vivax Brazil I]KMZ92763.1 hypothetical protein PVMG_01350 [Plasmodium vivax Mauritania I]KNA02302.1 hypothetical protein PVNG_01457 [Plasmodium vivax North Korean]EDL43501.1 hypothetical protein, conserved [Plasmodium vivax]|eukprot:XP_001613228.1 hypothetical protein [Plasmodium vivax Sal-1]
MATIMTMEFPSSDEEDDNYDVEAELERELKEGDLSDEVKEELQEEGKQLLSQLGKAKRNKRKNETNPKMIKSIIKNSIVKEKIEKTYHDINREYEQLYKHEKSVSDGDFLLQFHRKYPQEEKNYNTTQKLHDHLKKYSPALGGNEDSPEMDIKAFKEKCRNQQYSSDISNVVKNALENFYENNSVQVEKKYMYAGKVYTVQKKIDKTSSSYKRYLRMKDKMNIGGNFANIDQLVQSIQENKQINTVDKSTEDWAYYKMANSIDEEKLKAGQNYLENKFFSENVERKVYEHNVRKRAP